MHSDILSQIYSSEKLFFCSDRFVFTVTQNLFFLFALAHFISLVDIRCFISNLIYLYLIYLFSSRELQYLKELKVSEHRVHDYPIEIASLKGAGSRNVNKLLSKRRFCSIFDGPYRRDFPLRFSKYRCYLENGLLNFLEKQTKHS